MGQDSEEFGGKYVDSDEENLCSGLEQVDSAGELVNSGEKPTDSGGEQDKE